MSYEDSVKLTKQIEKYIMGHTSTEARVSLWTLLTLLYVGEMQRFPDCHDAIRERFEKEVECSRGHIFEGR